MIASDLTLPWFTDQAWILGIFVAALAIFHILLIRLFPLSAISWKRVDYIWLFMALIGLISAVGTGRAMIANNLLNYGKSRIEPAFHFMKMNADFGTSEAICRKFVKSDIVSPEDLSRIQREYDAQCDWFRTVDAKLAEINSSDPAPIDLIKLFGVQPNGGDEQTYKSFTDSVITYNSTVENINYLKRAKEPSDVEMIFRFLGPAILAVALALRITKVTGEIYHGKTSKSNDQRTIGAT
jgi:hypothetical protein